MAKDLDRGLDLSGNDKPAQIVRKTFVFYVGIDDYVHLPKLNNAVRDAQTIAEKLTTSYQCQIPTFAEPLINGEATRSRLDQRFKALTRAFKKAPYQHNLIIYYSGHGEWDEDFEAGYWALHGAKSGDTATYYANSALVTAINVIKSHHTLIISDSCFSGGLIDSNPKRSNRKETLRSRYVLASGLRDQLVSDGPSGKHSPFAQSILNFLEQEKGNNVSIARLEDFIEDALRQSPTYQQEPMFAPLVGIPDNQFGQLWLHPKFDVVQEVTRLVEAKEVAKLEQFIQVHADELRLRKKFSSTQKQLESLAWEAARREDTAPAYLDYLDKHLRTKNEHPEQAVEAVQLWLQQQEAHWTDLEDELASVQHRYSSSRKELKEQRQLTAQAKKEAAKVKEAHQQLETRSKEQEEKLQLLQTEKETALKQIKTFTQKEQELLARIKELETKPIITSPQFDFPVPEMVRIPGGRYEMGSLDGNDDEKPLRTVKISPFEIGKYPVTQREWEAIMGANPSHFKGDERPVEEVSWTDCQAFIKKLNKKTGLNFRLPTEAEWEYAAGGGSGKRTKWAGTNDEDSLSVYAWYTTNSKDQTHPVGEKKPNELGLYDMSGNVWEWCQDWYGDYLNKPLTNPTGPEDGTSRVLRGGSWYFDADYCRVTYRYNLRPGLRSLDIGFRLARSL